MTSSDVRLEVLTFPGCPHAEAAWALATAVAKRFDNVSVERVTVDDEKQAAAIGFLGSPSFQLNGKDVEGRSTTQGALCCRTYAEGAGIPPVWMVEAGVLAAQRRRGLLFLCVANSARSQMAEALARSLAPAGVKIWSAGSRPTAVRPEAIAVLAELGLDISFHRAKTVAAIPAEEVDTVITLCAEEECPVFLGRAVRLHWGLPDPAGVPGDSAARLGAFRQTRDELRRRLARVWP